MQTNESTIFAYKISMIFSNWVRFKTNINVTSPLRAWTNEHFILWSKTRSSQLRMRSMCVFHQVCARTRRRLWTTETKTMMKYEMCNFVQSNVQSTLWMNARIFLELWSVLKISIQHFFAFASISNVNITFPMLFSIN